MDGAVEGVVDAIYFNQGQVSNPRWLPLFDHNDNRFVVLDRVL